MTYCSTRCRKLTFLEKHTINGCKPAQTNVSAITEMVPLTARITRTRLLQPKEADSTPNRCKHKRSGSMPAKEERPVYFASKALTEAPKGYVAIEFESSAVVWALEKFHHFLYVSHFILETDQKPLEAILSKSLNQATPRYERILIRTFHTIS